LFRTLLERRHLELTAGGLKHMLQRLHRTSDVSKLICQDLILIILLLWFCVHATITMQEYCLLDVAC